LGGEKFNSGGGNNLRIEKTNNNNKRPSISLRDLKQQGNNF
jgi:hypothetical protein